MVELAEHVVEVANALQAVIRRIRIQWRARRLRYASVGSYFQRDVAEKPTELLMESEDDES